MRNVKCIVIDAEPAIPPLPVRAMVNILSFQLQAQCTDQSKNIGTQPEIIRIV